MWPGCLRVRGNIIMCIFRILFALFALFIALFIPLFTTVFTALFTTLFTAPSFCSPLIWFSCVYFGELPYVWFGFCCCVLSILSTYRQKFGDMGWYAVLFSVVEALCVWDCVEATHSSVVEAFVFFIVLLVLCFLLILLSVMH